MDSADVTQFDERRSRIHIGTSGWHYKHWKGPFYPERLPSADFLRHYVQHFHTVEINNSFYMLPQKETLRKWRDVAPKGFVFSVKANRYITHMKKLKNVENAVRSFLNAVDVLEEKRGPILFQLPPSLGLDALRLKEFLRILPSGYLWACEFRNPSWFSSEAYEILQRYQVAFCIYQLAGRLSPKEVTASLVYIRLHGPAGAYAGQYSTEVLAEWAEAISAWNRQGKEVYCYFDNDQAGYAAQDALRLQKMVR